MPGPPCRTGKLSELILCKSCVTRQNQPHKLQGGLSVYITTMYNMMNAVHTDKSCETQVQSTNAMKTDLMLHFERLLTGAT